MPLSGLMMQLQCRVEQKRGRSQSILNSQFKMPSHGVMTVVDKLDEVHLGKRGSCPNKCMCPSCLLNVILP